MLALLALVLVVFIVNYGMTKFEQAKYVAPGELVKVGDKTMHVYTQGEGENTIVLMSGLGTAAPVLDFKPLVDELAKTNKVVVVEPFGYGWSEVTDQQRSVENIVEELRMALKKSGLDGPYILMPHSVSGIYSMYFANQYPNEVKAVIGIDPTLPQALEYFSETAPVMPEYLSYLAPTGVARVALSINPENFLPRAAPGTYSEENLKMTKYLSAWKGFNKSVVAEANEIKNNVGKTDGMTFPPDLPVLLFMREDDKVNAEGKSNLSFYESQLTNTIASKIIKLEGHHYLHWTRYEEMGKEVDEFLESIHVE